MSFRFLANKLSYQVARATIEICRFDQIPFGLDHQPVVTRKSSPNSMLWTAMAANYSNNALWRLSLRVE
jgi:hypothetical protein